MLHRPGRKQKIAELLIAQFPVHRNYIELFYGAGGVFLNKPKASRSYLNDLDGEVHNFWLVAQQNMDKLIQAFVQIPIAEKTFSYLRTNRPSCAIQAAARFLYLSNFSYLSKMGTLSIRTNSNPKKTVVDLKTKTLKMIQNDVFFDNLPYSKVFGKISFESKNRARDLANTFVYNDPPYLDSSQTTYQTPKWTQTDFCDLLDCNLSWGVKFAVSEQTHPFVIEQATARGLNIIPIKANRRSMQGKNNEILITNYRLQGRLFE